MTINQCDGHNGTPEGFLELPQLVYRDDPNWVPSDPANVAAAFSAANTWFENGQAQLFAIPGKVRAAAFFEPRQRIKGEVVAFFGYFESTGDDDANRAVMDAIEAWSRAHGATALYGPIDFNTTTGYRLRLSVEPGGLPFLGEPYNPPSYPAALETLGFGLHQGYVSQLIPLEVAHRVMATVRPALQALRDEGYRFEQPTPEAWAQSLPELHQMVDAIFGENFAYTPLSYDAFAKLMGPALVRKICPRASVIVYGPDGDAVGFALAYPHWGPLMIQGRTDGPPIAPRDLDYRQHFQLLENYRPRAMISKTYGVHPAHRQKRLFSAIALESFNRSVGVYDFHYPALMRDDNHSVRLFESSHAGERRYGLYAKPLAAT